MTTEEVQFVSKLWKQGKSDLITFEKNAKELLGVSSGDFVIVQVRKPTKALNGNKTAEAPNGSDVSESAINPRGRI